MDRSLPGGKFLTICRVLPLANNKNVNVLHVIRNKLSTIGEGVNTIMLLFFSYSSVAGSCYIPGDHMSYTGDKTVSYTGAQCEYLGLSWEHLYAEFPDGSVIDSRNYCRNPNNEHPEGPWCLLLDVDQYIYRELCDVLLCSSAGWWQHCPWWRHDMETSSKLLNFVKGMISPSRKASNSGCWCAHRCWFEQLVEQTSHDAHVTSLWWCYSVPRKPCTRFCFDIFCLSLESSFGLWVLSLTTSFCVSVCVFTSVCPRVYQSRVITHTFKLWWKKLDQW